MTLTDAQHNELRNMVADSLLAAHTLIDDDQGARDITDFILPGVEALMERLYTDTVTQAYQHGRQDMAEYLRQVFDAVVAGYPFVAVEPILTESGSKR